MTAGADTVLRTASAARGHDSGSLTSPADAGPWGAGPRGANPAIADPASAGPRRLQDRGGAPGGGPVCTLPREVRLGAPEVAEGSRLGVDGPQQVQGRDDRARAQVEDLGDRVLDLLDRHLLGAEGLHEQPHRL